MFKRGSWRRLRGWQGWRGWQRFVITKRGIGQIDSSGWQADNCDLHRLKYLQFLAFFCVLAGYNGMAWNTKANENLWRWLVPPLHGIGNRWGCGFEDIAVYRHIFCPAASAHSGSVNTERALLHISTFPAILICSSSKKEFHSENILGIFVCHLGGAIRLDWFSKKT